MVLAPLMFVLFAEGSLAWRRQRLEAVEHAMDHLRNFGETERHLYFTKYITDADNGFDLEKKSIREADVRGETIKHDEFVQEFMGRPWPISDYLESSRRYRLENLVSFASIDPDHAGPILGVDSYQLLPGWLTESRAVQSARDGRLSTATYV